MLRGKLSNVGDVGNVYFGQEIKSEKES